MPMPKFEYPYNSEMQVNAYQSIAWINFIYESLFSVLCYCSTGTSELPELIHPTNNL